MRQEIMRSPLNHRRRHGYAMSLDRPMQHGCPDAAYNRIMFMQVSNPVPHQPGIVIAHLYD